MVYRRNKLRKLYTYIILCNKYSSRFPIRTRVKNRNFHIFIWVSKLSKLGFSLEKNNFPFCSRVKLVLSNQSEEGKI